MEEKGLNLVVLSSHDRVPAVRRLISSGAEGVGRKAEEALEILADNEGDGVAYQVLSDLSPLEHAFIIADKSGLASTVSFWLTPKQIVGAIKAQLLLVKGKVHEGEAIKIQNEAVNFFVTVLMQDDDLGRRRSILSSIAKDEDAFFYLILPFIGVVENTGKGYHILEHQTRELLDFIREDAPKLAARIIKTVLAEFDTFSEQTIAAYINEARQRLARDIQEREKSSTTVDDDMFKPLI